MIRFKNILLEEEIDNNLTELIKNLDIIAVLGDGLGKISSDTTLNNYRDINDLQIGKVDKIKEILQGIKNIIPKIENIINMEGNNGKEETRDENTGYRGEPEERSEEPEIDRRGDFEFTSPRKKLPTNF